MAIVITYPAKRKNKFGAKRTEYNGVMYDSLREAWYARELDLRRKAKNDYDRVVKVVRQPRFPIMINDKKICEYVADFAVSYADGREEIIEVKGYETPVWRLKKKMFEAAYPDKKLVIVK